MEFENGNHQCPLIFLFALGRWRARDKQGQKEGAEGEEGERSMRVRDQGFFTLILIFFLFGLFTLFADIHHSFPEF
ncbi:MAG: hypothetical protein NTW95_07575 [Candidatus Aminicenantes bacterium]|nr:hypothetical protein [Candidatus Aminicenantes bacterium]